MSDAEKTTLDGWLWRPRYWVARKLIYAGMRIMPECRYRRELNASLWTLGLRVQAHCAGLRAAGDAAKRAVFAMVATSAFNPQASGFDPHTARQRMTIMHIPDY